MSNIPRDSRGPLSGLFFCAICGSKMYLEGRSKGGYRCKSAAEGGCWNKATALKEIVHANISREVHHRIITSEAHLQALVRMLQNSLAQDTSLHGQIETSRHEVAELRRKREQLLLAIESSQNPSRGESSPKVLVERLAQREDALARAQAELDRLLTLKSEPSAIPDEAALGELLRTTGERLLDLDREAGVLLRRLTPHIEAVPYQQFGGDKVVLRARFELHVANLLPTQVQPFFEAPQEGVNPISVATHRCLVNLFAPSTGPEHFAQALALDAKGLGLTAIGVQLGITKRQAHIAVQYGRALRAADQQTPFVELKERPTDASRWRYRSV